eukprot:4657183-Amphidinium_carterae.1
MSEYQHCLNRLQRHKNGYFFCIPPRGGTGECPRGKGTPWEGTQGKDKRKEKNLVLQYAD